MGFIISKLSTTIKLGLELDSIKSWNKKNLFLETWCQTMEWDTNQVAHTFKTKIQI